MVNAYDFLKNLEYDFLKNLEKETYEIVATRNFLDIGLCVRKNHSDHTPKRVLASSFQNSEDDRYYGGVEYLDWISTGVYTTIDEWNKVVSESKEHVLDYYKIDPCAEYKIYAHKTFLEKDETRHDPKDFPTKREPDYQLKEIKNCLVQIQETLSLFKLSLHDVSENGCLDRQSLLILNRLSDRIKDEINQSADLIKEISPEEKKEEKDVDSFKESITAKIGFPHIGDTVILTSDNEYGQTGTIQSIMFDHDHRRVYNIEMNESGICSVFRERDFMVVDVIDKDETKDTEEVAER